MRMIRKMVNFDDISHSGFEPPYDEGRIFFNDLLFQELIYKAYKSYNTCGGAIILVEGIVYSDKNKIKINAFYLIDLNSSSKNKLDFRKKLKELAMEDIQ